MEGILQGIPHVTVYIDDILVTGVTDREHLQNLQEVLTRLEKAGIRLKKGKCMCFYVGRRGVPGTQDHGSGAQTNCLQGQGACGSTSTKGRLPAAVLPRTSQLLRQVHAKPVECSRPTEPAVAEVQEVVLGKRPIKDIPGSKGSPHFSDGTNALQS